MEEFNINNINNIPDWDKNNPMLSAVARIAGQMPGGFFIYRADHQQEILYANDVILDIFGCDNLQEFQELTGGTFRGIVCPGDFDSVESSIISQVSENKRHLDYVEYRITRKDGVIRWVDDYGRLVHTKDYGDVYYVLIRDITDLHESRKENIRRAEVIEGLSGDFKSIYLFNLDTGTMRPYRMRSEYFLAIASELGGAETQQANWKEILPVYAERYVIPEDRERFLCEISGEQIRRRLLAEQSYTVEYRCRDAQDEHATIYMQMSVILIENGNEPRHAVVGYRDITEQTLRVQRELREKLNMELELERERKANEIKSSFLFNLSHDIRTPMNAIMGYTELAKRHAGDMEKLKADLDMAAESGRHMLALIDDLLEMNRLDSGHIESKSEPCDLKEQLAVTLNLFRPQIKDKRLILHENFDLPDEKVLTDANRFRRVMGNFISNAVKFTPENGTVTISAKRGPISESGYARYQFTIADTGIGMTDEFMKRIYQAFEREETSTKSGYTGTGLGLSIAKRILDIMGGSVSVKSKKGEGSVFTIDLPLKLADNSSGARNDQTSVKSNTQSAPDDNHGSGQRILLVEDIEINRMLAEAILEESGFQVESAPDGCDAVDAFQNHPAGYYDLILMDIQMPVMNGYEATRAIRGLDRPDAKSIPIIALSANAREEDKRMSLESGMNHHIAKPFDVAQLIAAITAHTSDQSAARD